MPKNIRNLFFFAVTLALCCLSSCISIPKIQKDNYSRTFCLNDDEKTVKDYPKCAANSPEGTFCTLDINEIRPTQFNYGDAYVEDIKVRFTHNVSKAQDFFCNKPPTIVIGPYSVPGFFLTDGHHRMKLAEKLMNEDRNIFTLLVRVDRNVMLKEPLQRADAFWLDMLKHNDVYLKDKGVFRPANELPIKIQDVTNDPYRSLAGFIADDKSHFCFNTKLSNYGNFAEFYWGDYIRKMKGLNNYKDNIDYKTIKEKIENYDIAGQGHSVNICKLPYASGLPGFSKE